METTPQSVLETFERNRQAVRDLLHFDEIILNVVTHNLEALNERWKRYLRREASNPDVKVNPKYTADDLLKLVANIRANDSLGGQYRAMHNQCLVLLVSFFSSSTRALFRAFVAQELQSSKTEIFSEKLQFTVGDLCSDEAPFSELVADALEQSKSISFQDMGRIKGVGSLFTSPWRTYDHEELINRDEASLDIFWLRDEDLEESDISRSSSGVGVGLSF
jgi:hypothetical protein